MTAVAESPVINSTPSAPALPRVRRVVGAGALFLAGWGFVVCNAMYAWSIRHGGTDENGVAALALAAENPLTLRICIVAGLLGCLLIIPAVIAAVGLAHRSSAALVGGAMMIIGYVCYFGVLITNVIILAMADFGPAPDFAAAIDAAQGPLTAWVFLLFVIGNIIGTAIFGIGLLRSRSVPIGAAVAILSWPPLHVVGLIVGSEWFEVTGAVFQAVGLAVIGARLLAGPPSRRDESRSDQQSEVTRA